MSPEPDEVTVDVGGRRYRGWEEIQISRGVDSLAGTFRLVVSNVVPWPIRPGDEVEVRIGADRVLLGYVDELEGRADGRSTSRTVSGRDRTGDLVDCSVEAESFGARFVSVRDVVAAAVEPFGIPFVPPPISAPGFDAWDYRVGETVFDTLERAARLRGLLLHTDSEGRLAVNAPGVERFSGALSQPGNVLSSEVRISFAERFSEYIVRGQQPGADGLDPLAAAQAEGRATDPSIHRHRPLILQAEGPVDDDDARLRAEWEATFRRAKSATLTCIVQGWRQEPGGRLWAPNLIGTAVIRDQQVEGDFLTNRVTYSLTESEGTRTTLELVAEDAYLPRPEAPEEDAFSALLEEAEF